MIMHFNMLPNHINNFFPSAFINVNSDKLMKIIEYSTFNEEIDCI